MTCKRIEELRGNKSERIRQLLERKLQERNIANASKILNKDKHIAAYIIEHKTAEKKVAEWIDRKNATHNDIQKRAKQILGVAPEFKYGVVSIYQNKVHLSTNYRPTCIVEEHASEQLQRASDMFAIGKHKEANKIWDSIIKEYELV